MEIKILFDGTLMASDDTDDLYVEIPVKYLSLQQNFLVALINTQTTQEGKAVLAGLLKEVMRNVQHTNQ